jgi:class 3 adenylate cyclase/TolB-like protein/Tfp pilus assembly protein PilF
MKTSHPRKLAAILFADIVGYTAMMQKDETNAMSALDLYQSTLQELVSKYEGEIIKNYGDGSICLFSSTMKALLSAQEIQRKLGKEVPLRIGLHLGDVIYKDGDIYGDAINITSRIESMGIAGNVLLSDSFYYKVKNISDVSFSSLGMFDFKNVDRPIKVYALSSPGIAVPKRSEIVGKLKGRLKKDYKRAAFTIIAASALIYFLFQPSLSKIKIFFYSNSEVQTNTLAVLNFENNTGNIDYDRIGNMLSDRIIHGITQNDLAMVVSGESFADYNKILLASVIPQDKFGMLQDRFHVDKVINGNYYLDGEELLIEATIVDLATNKIIKGFQPIRCSIENPLTGIQKLRESVLGYLASESDKELNLLLETHTPKYEAYLELLKAKEVEDDVKMLEYLEKAIALDSNYFEPQVLRLSSYYNLGEYRMADSLRKVMLNKSIDFDKRQKNLLNFYDALLNGQNNLIYQYFKNEYDLAPYDLMSNNSQIVLALQFINDVEPAIPMYEVIPEADLDFANCERCRTRLYVKIYIDLESGHPEKAINTAQLLKKNGGNKVGIRLMIRALVQTEKWADLEELIEQEGILSQGNDLLSLCLDAAGECLMNGENQKSIEYAQRAKKYITPQSDDINVSRVHLMLGEWDEAELVLKNHLKSKPDRLYANAFLAGIYLAKKEPYNADVYFTKLESLRGPFQYGDIDYVLALAHIIGGNPEKALGYLKASVLQGQRYTFHQFKHDYLFVPIRENSTFQDLLTYWQI